MKFLLTAAVVVILLSPSVGAGERSQSGSGGRQTPGFTRERPTPPVRAREAYRRLPLSFEQNHGQTDPAVRFLARGSGYTVFLTSSEAVLTLQRRGPATSRRLDGISAPSRARHRPDVAERAVVRMKLSGANRDVLVGGLDARLARVNYFVGDEPASWRCNVALYSRVRYQNVYAGIDLIYYGSQGQLEYDFIVAPGADPGAIGITFEGVTMAVEANGDLVGRLGADEVRMQKPTLYQQVDGVRVPIRGAWILAPDGKIGFNVSRYDTTRPLVIDPVLSYATYLGGSQGDAGNGVAVDGAGNVYITGYSQSPDFPVTSGAYQTAAAGLADAFVAKLDPTGTSLLYATYLGGGSSEFGSDIAVDALGHAYLAGATMSADFPTTAGAFQPAFGGGDFDGFVSRLDPSGSTLMYSSYLGGTSTDFIERIAVDAADHAYVAGQAYSSDFPTTAGAFQTSFQGGASDAFVTKVNPAGSALVYSTYLGGSNGFEAGGGVSVDALGHAYISGTTQSVDFPTTAGAFQPLSAGASDAFVTKLDPAGSALVYSTYLGGAGDDAAFRVAIDPDGHAFVTGETLSAGFPVTASAFQRTFGGGSDIFVTKLDPAGSGLVFSTYLGGSANERGYDIAVDRLGNAYVAGGNEFGAFPTTGDAFQSAPGGSTDALVAKLDSTASNLLFSSYLGGTPSDFALAMALRAEGGVHLTGFTGSGDFPVTADALQAVLGGGTDAFLATISEGAPTSLGTITGGGAITVEGGLGTFGFVVTRKMQDGGITGSLQYINHATGVRVRGTSFTSLVVDGGTATFGGACVVNGSPCSFTVTATDSGRGSGGDAFVMAISSGPPEGGTLRGGNIRMHD